jgi:hypothetical protein
MNNIVTILSKSFILVIFSAFVSCGGDLEIKAPIFKNDFNQTIQEVTASGKFSDVAFKVSANQTNNEKPEYELELKLLNGKNLPGNEQGLDSLAKNASTIFKNSIQNINDYDWISVIFDYDDGTVIDATKKNVFVYRPNALK